MLHNLRCLFICISIERDTRKWYIYSRSTTILPSDCCCCCCCSKCPIWHSRLSEGLRISCTVPERPPNTYERLPEPCSLLKPKSHWIYPPVNIVVNFICILLQNKKCVKRIQDRILKELFYALKFVFSEKKTYN